MDNISYQDINSRAVDSWVADGWVWGVPISPEQYAAACRDEWDVLLTPQTFVPHDWFAPFIRSERLDGVRLLGLACGGGQQMPVFSALGADCTVLDYSQNQLDSEKMVAEREGYNINIVRADMTKRLPFDDCAFDLIFHPVSNCYVEDVKHIWRECARVLKPGGVLLAGMDNGFTYMFDEESDTPLMLKYKLPYNPLKDPALMKEAMEKGWGVQFSHTIEEQLGGQLEAGLVLTHIRDDGTPDSVLDEYFPQFLFTRAVKPTL